MSMYILRRLIAGLVLFVVTSFVTYWMLSFSFESVIFNRIGPSATPEAVATMMADMGLDRPLVVQYIDWLGGVFRGDFGRAVFTQEVISQAIPPRISVTLSVVIPSLVLSTIVAVLAGVWAAYRGGVVDKIVQGLMMLGTLIPQLLVAISLVVILAINLEWLPATGYVRFSDDPVGWARSIAIPVATLFLGGAAGIATQVRGTMIDELRKDYVRTLRTSGVSPLSILLRHALRNAAGPALTVFGLSFIAMFGGALMIEMVFALPGFGMYAFNSTMQGDFGVLLAVSAVGVFITVCTNLLVDLANGWLNPKARIY